MMINVFADLVAHSCLLACCKEMESKLNVAVVFYVKYVFFRIYNNIKLLLLGVSAEAQAQSSGRHLLPLVSKIKLF